MSDTTPPWGPDSGSDRLRRTAEEARDAAADRLGSARDEAMHQARSAAEDARDYAEKEAERGKAAGAGQVHKWASALNRAASELGEDSAQGQLVRQASEGLDDIARSIEGRSVGQMVGAVSDFGRRNPAAFIGGAMLAGFALSRFATASRPEPDRDDIRDHQPTPQPTPRPSPASMAPPPTPTADAPTGTATTASSGFAGGATPGGAGTGEPSPASFDQRSADRDDEDGPLTLTEGMRPSGFGAASEPGGTGRPYPSAGSPPGGHDTNQEDDR